MMMIIIIENKYQDMTMETTIKGIAKISDEVSECLGNCYFCICLLMCIFRCCRRHTTTTVTITQSKMGIRNERAQTTTIATYEWCDIVGVDGKTPDNDNHNPSLHVYKKYIFPIVIRVLVHSFSLCLYVDLCIVLFGKGAYTPHSICTNVCFSILKQ